MKQAIINMALCATLALLLLMAAYYGMSKSLCARLDTFTASEQAGMGLDAKTCATYY